MTDFWIGLLLFVLSASWTIFIFDSFFILLKLFFLRKMWCTRTQTENNFDEMWRRFDDDASGAVFLFRTLTNELFPDR